MDFWANPIHLTYKTAKTQKLDNTPCWRGCEKTGSLYIAGVNAQWNNSLKEKFIISNQRTYAFTLWPLQRHTTNIPKIHIWEVIHCIMICNCKILEASMSKHRIYMEPWFLNLLCSGKRFEKWLVRKWNILFLSPDRCMTNNKGISTKGLLGRESRPYILLDNWDAFSMNNLVTNQDFWERRFDFT